MHESDAAADLLVIGGGITGAGIAQNAASRGLKTILVEKGDFAGGTSSKSSKMVHGGLRYLEHFSLGLMRESIRERQTLARLAPGLVCWAPFMLPYYVAKESRWKYEVGLWLYDHLARTSPDLKHRSLNISQTLEHSPQLRKQGLAGGSLFHDCVTDDARLTLAVTLDAQMRGARVFNYVKAEELIREREKAVGVSVREVLTGRQWAIHARQIVVAAGPWTDQTLGMLGESQRSKSIRPAKGVHVVLPRGRLEVRQVLLIPSARDRRFLFVIPWYEGLIVGTTDTEYQDDPDLIRPELADIEYILDALNWSFPDARLGIEDVVSSYAGIRPLVNVPGKSTADVPREYKIFESASGLISVAGGKLTTYRLMAKVVVDRVVRRLRSENRSLVFLPCWTHRIKLGSPPDRHFDPFGKLELAEDVRAHLLADYGTWTQQIVSILAFRPEWQRRITPGLPHILAEVSFAVTWEKAQTLEDVLARRTRVALLARDQGRSCVKDVCEIMKEQLNWDSGEVDRQRESYEAGLRTKYCVHIPSLTKEVPGKGH